jgi:hypothetical protein
VVVVRKIPGSNSGGRSTNAWICFYLSHQRYPCAEAQYDEFPLAWGKVLRGELDPQIKVMVYL